MKGEDEETQVKSERTGTGRSEGGKDLHRGRTHAKKTAFFYTKKKSRLRKSENAVRLLYAKKQ